MPLEYDLDTHIKSLETVLEDYTEWFLHVTRCLFYPGEAPNGRDTLTPPDSFANWAQTVQNNGSIPPGNLERLKSLQRDLAERAVLLMDDVSRQRIPPAYNEYKKLTVLFEEFAGHIRRLEKDRLLEDSGLDALTGLRNKEALEKDIKREMDRLARQGKTFAVAIVRIDNFSLLQKEMTQAEIDGCIKLVAGFIKKSVRSFDDAYRMDDGMFVLSLKQTGNSGGIQALKRLKAETDKAKASFRINGKIEPLSLSSCIGEPMDGEDITAFLENLKKDLGNAEGAKGSVVEYFELSPLQRYIREKG